MVPVGWVQESPMAFSAAPRCLARRSGADWSLRSTALRVSEPMFGCINYNSTSVYSNKITLCDVTCRSQAFTLSTLSSFRLFPAMTALRFDANLFDRDVHLMRSPARHTRRQDNPVRIEHQVVGYYVVGGGSCRSRNEPRSGTGVSPRMCPSAEQEIEMKVTDRQRDSQTSIR